VVIPNGVNNSTFLFTVVADDMPEVDEQFLVTLITVNEPNQMIVESEEVSYIYVHRPCAEISVCCKMCAWGSSRWGD
jgi:hypothetical protein